MNDILWRIGAGKPRPQVGDCGEETEDDARQRLTDEWYSQNSKMQEFIEDNYRLSLAIVLAACTWDATPSPLAKLELVRAIDAARETFIEKGMR